MVWIQKRKYLVSNNNLRCRFDLECYFSLAVYSLQPWKQASGYISFPTSPFPTLGFYFSISILFLWFFILTRTDVLCGRSIVNRETEATGSLDVSIQHLSLQRSAITFYTSVIHLSTYYAINLSAIKHYLSMHLPSISHIFFIDQEEDLF